MKKYVKFRRLWLFTLLLVVPCVGFAMDAPASPLWDMFRNLSFNPPAEDVSVSLLAQLFGYVPGVPQLYNVGTTILSPIFGVFNAGILAISGVFLSYTIFKVVTETTMEGTAMGKTATIWTAVRVGISTGLLIPQASGYSVLNGIIMWVVIQSIGLADLTWSSALNYLGTGGSVTTTQKRQTDYSLVNYTLGNDSTAKDVGSADVLRSLVCADTIREALQTKQKALQKAEQANSEPRVVPDVLGKFSFYYDNPDKHMFSFPYMRPITVDNKPNQSPLKLWDDFDKEAAKLDLTGICGKITYGTKDKNYEVAKRAGLERMISSLDSLSSSLLYKADHNKLDALNYVLYKVGKSDVYFATKVKDNTTGKTELDYTNLTINTQGLKNKTPLPGINWPISTDSLLKVALEYQLTLEPVQIAGQAHLDDEIKDAITTSKNHGWITAGSYYYLLQNIEQTVGKKLGDYRLQFYVVSEEQENNAKQSRATPPYGTFYSTLKPQSELIQAIRKLDPAYEGGEYNVNTSAPSKFETSMKEALEWIWYTVPYTELRGKSLTSLALDKVGTEEGKGVGVQWEYSYQTTDTLDSLNAKLNRAAIAAGTVYVPFVNILSVISLPIFAGLPMDYLVYDVREILKAWNNLMNEEDPKKTDPIVKLHNLGDEMMKQSIEYFKQIKHMFTVITSVFMGGAFVVQNLSWMLLPWSYWGVSTGAQMAAQSSISVGGMIQNFMQTILYMNLPLGLAIIGPLFVTGVTLSIYVPLIPYMLFLFGVISWFISVLVLMVAAPIICFLMLWGTTSQENPLLSREAEQFVMQIIGVFFRPTLMVVGLIVGIALSYIGVEVLNKGFAQLFLKVVDVDDVETVMGLVKSMGFVVIYTFVMVSVVNMCFSTIHVLYSEVMRIAQIQAPAVGMEEKHMEAVKAGTTEFSQAGAAGGKESATTMHGKAPTPTHGPASPRKKKKDDNMTNVK